MFSELGARLADVARTRVSDGALAVDLGASNQRSCLAAAPPTLAGRAVLLATQSQVLAAAAMVELDGLVDRLVIAPPDLRPEHVAAVIEDAAIDVVATDRPDLDAGRAETAQLAFGHRAVERRGARGCDTGWVLATSGTTGRPKLVLHTLAGLAGAIAQAPPGPAPGRWATFYDIRRYGGLQILLRSLLGGTDLVLSRPGEPVADHLRRLGAAGASSISGTPSHWRRVLMSAARDTIAPAYVRLSGEIADQGVLDGLRAAYPGAAVGHAFASTEAGVCFAVDDGLEGFPDALLSAPGAVSMKVVEGSLRVRSARTATGYLGAPARPLVDADGFVDTGDLVERRGERWYFVGRRGGIINVGGAKVNPEEVEATLNGHPAVRMSLVKGRRNPLTGALVVADIVLATAEGGGDDLRAEILAFCRTRLDAHKVPALLSFVPGLPLTAGGKLSRDLA